MADLLIVDDDEDIAGAIADLLTCEGHVVRTAHDGLEGLARLRESKADLILLDVDMPRLTGPAMAYEAFLLDAGLERIPIVLMSARQDLPRVASRVGTPYFLAKPSSFEVLQEQMARALAERTPPRPTVHAA
jgi:DNA-binding NtrC family response regulator